MTDSGEQPRVVVTVTPGCHLCDDACAVVAQVCGDHRVAWVSRPLSDLDPAAQARWRELVPVVEVDGRVHDVFRVDATRLGSALAEGAARLS